MSVTCIYVCTLFRLLHVHVVWLYFLFTDCVSEYCSYTALFLPCNIHVDVDGGSGAICGTCEGVCH